MNDNNITYRCLKEGWTPLPELAERYNLNMYRRTILIAKLNEEFKEQIGTTWVVLEEEALKLI